MTSDFPLPGSSPLSRGIPAGAGPHDAALRIIPALAGNTRPPKPPCAPTSDHPRSRGEYSSTMRRLFPDPGSSPLSRGIPSGSGGGDAAIRIIPALAGNTDFLSSRAISVKDHPRSRGEYIAVAIALFGVPGSSPLSRGIPTDGPVTALLVRIIPALAGNTRGALPAAPPQPDHPRARGG